MKYKLEAPFRYISGVIERRYNSDGSCESLIARKDGTIFWRRTYRRYHHGTISRHNPDTRL